MNRIVSLLFVFITGFSYAQTEIENIHQTIVALDQALVAKDSVTLKNLLTDDFIGAVPSGDWFYKSDYIRYHCRPGMGLIQLNTQPINKTNIRFFGNTAIINRRVEAVRLWPDGKKENLTVQRIEVCTKINNQWKIVGGQGTKVMEGQALPK